MKREDTGGRARPRGKFGTLGSVTHATEMEEGLPALTVLSFVKRIIESRIEGEARRGKEGGRDRES